LGYRGGVRFATTVTRGHATPPIDSCGGFVHSTDAAGNTLGGICDSMVERFPLPRLRFIKSFGYLNFELFKMFG